MVIEVNIKRVDLFRTLRQIICECCFSVSTQIRLHCHIRGCQRLEIGMCNRG